MRVCHGAVEESGTAFHSPSCALANPNQVLCSASQGTQLSSFLVVIVSTAPPRTRRTVCPVDVIIWTPASRGWGIWLFHSDGSLENRQWHGGSTISFFTCSPLESFPLFPKKSRHLLQEKSLIYFRIQDNLAQGAGLDQNR